MIAGSAALGTRLLLAGFGASRQRLAAGDWRLPCHRLGRRGGERWLLLHGLGATAATWLPLLTELRREADLALPELSMLGGARGPTPALGPRDGARAALAALDALGWQDDVTLAGTSLGGWIAVRAALGAPHRFRRLVLLNPGGFRHQNWQEVERAVAIESGADARRFLAALFARPPRALAALAPLLARVHRSPAVAHLLATLREDDAFDERDLAALALPTALVWGEHDGIFRLAVGERMAAAFPNATLYRIARAAHAAHWERPRAVAAAIADFRARHPAA